MYIKYLQWVQLLCWLQYCFGRIHKLEVSNDGRKYIALSTFGFYQGGILSLHLINFRAHPQNESAVFGFSLDRTINDAMNPYLDTHQEHCILQDPLMSAGSNATGSSKLSDSPGQLIRDTAAITYFIMDLKQLKLRLKCGDQKLVHIYKDRAQIPAQGGVMAPPPKRHAKRSIDTSVTADRCSDRSFTMTSKTNDNDNVYYNASFAVYVASVDEEGLYNVYFHNCPNYNNLGRVVNVDFTIDILEQNVSSFLSAGEMPLPALYSMMAILFLLSGMFWVFLLRQSKHPVFKIHYMMAVLVFLKSISLAFHGVNYHYIEYLGVHFATWAVLFYVVHLLKGALLFIVLVLIGTGWTFIKHVLTPRDKRLFMTVIPLQVFANVVEIILEESEEGARDYLEWRNIFILVDLLCCGCILFPVVWSIRHLQEASETDGKAAINLRKLKLFRHFYVMIVCYIYFTRFIVYLLRLTVPFQYGWLDKMFREMATYVFFVLTAYKFRPAAQNPYFTVSDDENDNDGNDIVLTESGVTECLNRVNNTRLTRLPPIQSTIIEVSEEEKEALLTQSESSHEYD